MALTVDVSGMADNKRGVDAGAVVAALRSAIGRGAESGFVPLHAPRIAGAEWTYVKDCLDAGWVSSVGSYVGRFEEMLAERCGVAHAVAVVNGTAALQVSLRLAGVQAADEVIIPAATFVATANAVSYLGAVPHFADSSTLTLGLDPEKLGAYLKDIAEVTGEGMRNRLTGRRLAAIVPMHTFGHPVDMEALAEVGAQWNLPIVEDAAESLGSFYKERPCGSLGLVAAVSFNGNKIITTGGGGAILTNDAELARHAKHLTTTAKVPHKWAFNHDETGYNYRLPNLNAAMGCAQLEQLDGFLQAKAWLADRYNEEFSELKGVSFYRPPSFARSNNWLNCLLLDTPDMEARNAVLDATNDAGLMTRPLWTLMPDLPMYAGCPSMDLPVARALEACLINIPSSVELGEAI
jgi:perosamine synthetase